jgi:hypothetical protein
MLRKETREVEGRVCDLCQEPKDIFSLDTKLDNCFTCGIDLCIEHTKKLGDLRLCSDCHQRIWNHIKSMKEASK